MGGGWLVLINMKSYSSPISQDLARRGEETQKTPLVHGNSMNVLKPVLRTPVQTTPYGVKKDTTVARSAGAAPRSISGI